MPQKLEMKLLEMGKDMKVKHSISNISPKVWGTFFLKKLWKGEKNIFGQICGGLFYMDCNDQIMQGWRKSFTDAFFSNPSTVNRKIFPGHGGRHT